MNAVRRFVPVLLLVVLSLYLFTHYDRLPQVAVHGLLFLPPLLALTVAFLALHFNRSAVFFYLLLIVICNVVLGLGWLSSPLSYALLALLVPLWLLYFSLLTERGVFNRRALPAHMALPAGLVLMWLLLTFFPQTSRYYLLMDWLPARYFDWTGLPQTVLFVSVAVAVCLLVLSVSRPASHRVAALGILLLLVLQLHFGAISRGLTVLSSGALLICVYAVLQESWRMAYLDELTELPARRALREKFNQLSGMYTLAMLDVDHFKKFNDRYGHDTGDAVLRMIAARIRRVSGGGVAYRYGGEEFTLLFSGKDREQAAPHLQAVCENIASSPFVINREGRRKSDRHAAGQQAKTAQITVSIGLADSGQIQGSPWDVIKLADKALYRAKKQGRNRVVS